MHRKIENLWIIFIKLLQITNLVWKFKNPVGWYIILTSEHLPITTGFVCTGVFVFKRYTKIIISKHPDKYLWPWKTISIPLFHFCPSVNWLRSQEPRSPASLWWREAGWPDSGLLLCCFFLSRLWIQWLETSQDNMGKAKEITENSVSTSLNHWPNTCNCLLLDVLLCEKNIIMFA